MPTRYLDEVKPFREYITYAPNCGPCAPPTDMDGWSGGRLPCSYYTSTKKKASEQMNTTQLLRRLLPFLALAASLQLTPGYYDPAAQRWINRDPIGELGGADVYRFAGNSGVSRTDALGLFDPGTGTAIGVGLCTVTVSSGGAGTTVTVVCGTGAAVGAGTVCAVVVGVAAIGAVVTVVICQADMPPSPVTYPNLGPINSPPISVTCPKIIPFPGPYSPRRIRQ